MLTLGGGGGGLGNNHSSIKCFVMNQMFSNLVCSFDMTVVRINFQLQLWALIIIDDISSYSNIKLSNIALYGGENAINYIF